MRYLLLLIIYAFPLFSLAQSTTVYQELKSGKLYEQKNLTEATESKINTFRTNFPSMKTDIEVKIIKEFNRNDSLFKVFDWEIKFEGNMEGVYEYQDKFLPEYTFKTIEGEDLKLDELQGKPIFIDLWFTSCKPCIEKFPDLNKLAKKYEDEIHFLAITFNSPKEVEKLMKKHSLNFTHLVDAEDFLDNIGQKLYPKILLLDKSGKVVYISESFKALDKKDLQRLLENQVKAN